MTGTSSIHDSAILHFTETLVPKLSDPLDSVRPISLPYFDDSPINEFESLSVAGFGPTEQSDENLNNVTIITIMALPPESCDELAISRDMHICAGGGERGLCDGDSDGLLWSSTRHLGDETLLRISSSTLAT
jgi:hypothetical protein